MFEEIRFQLHGASAWYQYRAKREINDSTIIFGSGNIEREVDWSIDQIARTIAQRYPYTFKPCICTARVKAGGFLYIFRPVHNTPRLQKRR